MEQNGVLKVPQGIDFAALNKVLLSGDLSRLNEQEKTQYYNKVCETVGLNPLTKPFEYIKFQGKEVLYAGKNCAEQLRQINSVSIEIVSREIVGDLLVVTARAKGRDGRVDESIGALVIKGLSGLDLANAMMKTETKAKRRATLSICGLGMLDETEVADLPKDAPYLSEPIPVVVEVEPKPTFYDLSKLASDKLPAAIKMLKDAGAKTEDEMLMYWESPKQIKKLENYEVQA